MPVVFTWQSAVPELLPGVLVVVVVVVLLGGLLLLLVNQLMDQVLLVAVLAVDGLLKAEAGNGAVGHSWPWCGGHLVCCACERGVRRVRGARLEPA